ncbi:MAG: hypothetical protein ABI200_05760 [Gaiellales bacterium]
MCLSSLGLVGQAPAAEPLPAPLLAQLQADIDRSQASLTAARRKLARTAKAEQRAAADAERIRLRNALVERVANIGPLRLPAAIEKRLDATHEEKVAAAARREAALEKQTTTTASVQAIALDADRRLRALKRASATEDERDTSLGSWRFGSGGPSVSAATIDDYLATKGSPLAGQGAAFLESGVKHKVDPRLVVAIAGAESYFGILNCAPHNAWGWGCPTSPYRFATWAQAIDTITLGLRENYLDGGRTSVGEIHLKYAPPNAGNDPTNLNYAWANNVAKFLIEQGGDPQAVGGVLGPSR